MPIQQSRCDRQGDPHPRSRAAWHGAVRSIRVAIASSGAITTFADMAVCDADLAGGRPYRKPKAGWKCPSSEENPRAGARGHEGTRGRASWKRIAHALLASVLLECRATPTLRRLCSPMIWGKSLHATVTKPGSTSRLGRLSVARWQTPRPRSLLTKRCPAALTGGYAHRGLRPEVGRGPLWRVSNPFATQPSQPRQKAVCQ